MDGVLHRCTENWTYIGKKKKSGVSSPPANGRNRFCRRVIVHLLWHFNPVFQ